jgi:hypothetical protein
LKKNDAEMSVAWLQADHQARQRGPGRPWGAPGTQRKGRGEAVLEQRTGGEERRTEAVAGLTSTAVVKLPSSFSAAAAHKIAALKGADAVLVEDRGQVLGAVEPQALADAPSTAMLFDLVSRPAVSVAAETPPGAAEALMAAMKVDCLPVVRDGLLLGVVLRKALRLDPDLDRDDRGRA